MKTKAVGRDLTSWSVVLLLLGVWELVSRLGIVNPDYLPPFSRVVQSWISLASNGSLGTAVAQTMVTFLIASVIGIIVGACLGLLLGRNRTAYQMFALTIEMLRPIPAIALIPIAILWFGTSTTMEIILVSYATMWPVLWATLKAVHAINPDLRHVAAVFDISTTRAIRTITLPAALSSIVVSCRVASAFSLIAAITLEIITGTRGLGGQIFISQSAFQMPSMYAYISTTAVIGYLINGLWVQVARQVAKHRTPNPEGDLSLGDVVTT